MSLPWLLGVVVVNSEHTTEADTEATSPGRQWGVTLGNQVDQRRLVAGAGLLTLLVLAARTTHGLLVNAPFDPVVVPPALRTGVATGVPVVVGGALAVVALTDDRPAVRVGLLFAGVFGLLGVFLPTVTLPAVVAIACGAGLALFGSLGRLETLSYRGVRRRLLGAGFVVALTVSLADGTGIVRGLHGTGSLVALSAVALVGTRAARSLPAAGAGVLAAAGVVYAGSTSPFVLGSALLVVFAVSGVPPLLFALAVAGGTAAATAGLSRRLYPLATGACLLVLAGVPVTLPRAMTFLLGATLVTLDWEQPVGGSA